MPMDLQASKAATSMPAGSLKADLPTAQRAPAAMSATRST
jgi:hypothetical protein